MAGTEALYAEDAYLREFEATVLAVDSEGRRIALDRTIFFPGGGGQPHDLGTLAGLPVESVARDGELIWHTLGGDGALPSEGDARRRTARLGAPPRAHANPHGAARPLRRDLARPRGEGHGREHGAAPRADGLRARGALGRARARDRDARERGGRGRSPGSRRLPAARGGRPAAGAHPHEGQPAPGVDHGRPHGRDRRARPAGGRRHACRAHRRDRRRSRFPSTRARGASTSASSSRSQTE